MSRLITLPHGALAAALLALGAIGLSACTAPGTAGPTGAAHEPSPLEKYYSVLYGGGSDEASQEREAKVQDAIAACMKEQGFDYLPQQSGAMYVSSEDMEVAWGSEEFAKTYGYGASTDTTALFGGGEETVDPNADYVEALSESERAAYYTALYGAPPSDDGGVSVDTEWDWRGAGCTGAAQHEFGVDSAEEGPESSSLLEEMSGLYEKAMASPDVVAAERAWSDCLADAGYPGYEHHDDPSASFNDRMNELSGEDGADKPDETKLKALQAEEIATATADWHCSDETGYTTTRDRVQRRLEQEFVDAHEEELDALVARRGGE